jgi:ribosomal protein S18 acetylase RimI-like enzyme
VTIRDFHPDDAPAVNAIALAAFQQYQGHYDDWPAFLQSVGAMSTLAQTSELIVTLAEGRIAGAVGYVGPGRPKPAQFDPRWAIIRMLVVDPAARGRGLGRALTLECVRRAGRDRAAVIALHTSPFMTVALEKYLQLGSSLTRKARPSSGRRPRSMSSNLRRGRLASAHPRRLPLLRPRDYVRGHGAP